LANISSAFAQRLLVNVTTILVRCKFREALSNKGSQGPMASMYVRGRAHEKPQVVDPAPLVADIAAARTVYRQSS
jgi:hypothetical protein